MFCQFRALGSLHSNCQGHKAGGKWRMQDDWCNRRLNKKATVCVWYVLGGFQSLGGGEGGNGLHVILLVLSVLIFFYSLPQMWKRLHSCHKACWNIMLCMEFWRMRGTLLASMSGNERKNPFCSVGDTALWCFITSLFVHVWLHNLVHTKRTPILAPVVDSLFCYKILLFFWEREVLIYLQWCIAN